MKYEVILESQKTLPHSPKFFKDLCDLCFENGEEVHDLENSVKLQR